MANIFPNTLPNTLIVMAGGAVGSALRYQLGRLSFHLWGGGWPWGTLAANLIGGFAMGLLAGVLAARGAGGEAARLLLAVGVLGGFTTFSAFSLETALMLQRGETMAATAYILVSVMGAVAALMLGLTIVRVVTA